MVKLAASSVIEFQTSSAGGDNEGTEITSYCDVWWRCREGLGKVAVLFVRKLNPYPDLTLWNQCWKKNKYTTFFLLSFPAAY